MEIQIEDTDVDGFFDLWRYDLDGDGKYEREFRLDDDRAFLVPFDYGALREAYMSDLAKIVEDNQRLIEVLKAALAKVEPKFAVDAVEEYFSSRLVKEYDRGFGLGAKIKNSLAGTRDATSSGARPRLLAGARGRWPALTRPFRCCVAGITPRPRRAEKGFRAPPGAGSRRTPSGSPSRSKTPASGTSRAGPSSSRSRRLKNPIRTSTSRTSSWPRPSRGSTGGSFPPRSTISTATGRGTSWSGCGRSCPRRKPGLRYYCRRRRPADYARERRRR
jgi:hypothetical protein